MNNLNMFNLNTLKEADYITLTNSFPTLSGVSLPLQAAVSNGSPLQLYSNPLQAYGYQFTAAQPTTSMIGVKSAPAAPAVSGSSTSVTPASSSKAHRSSSSANNTQSTEMSGTSSGGGAQIVCDLCKKKFSTIYNKKRHEDMFHHFHGHGHAQQITPANKCSMCNKTFNSIYNKKRHEATHKPIDQRLKFKCQYPNCNKDYTTVSILKIHMKKVHNIELANEQAL